VNDWSYTVLVQGDSTAFRELGVPLCEDLENELGKSAATRDEIGQSATLDFTGLAQPRAFPSALGAIIGIILFTAGWSAKKLLDEVYELKIRPHVRRLLGEADNKIPKKSSRSNCKYAFMLAVWHDSIKRTVVAVCIGETFSGVLTSEQHVWKVHQNACELLTRDIQSKLILLYLITEGEFPERPLLFENMREVHNFLESLSTDSRKQRD
jgi:hypothetical protein